MSSPGVLPSQLIQAILPVKGQPLDMQGYLPFRDIYDIDAPCVVIKSSRQTGKSLFTSNNILSRGILSPYSVSLYVAPLSQQTSRFSTMYLDPGLTSPLVKKYFTKPANKRNVFEKHLSNNSIIFLGYADTADSTDRLRGISVSGPGRIGATCYIDEAQDCQSDMLPVIWETMAAAEHPNKRIVGTAKGESNTLELEFKKSSQNEWCVKCDHCGKWTIPVDEYACMKIVANPLGPGCMHCGKIINMAKGKWLAARPEEKSIIGFHPNALILPIRNRLNKWQDILEKVRTYPKAKLLNEVFGIAAGSGNRILSIREAQACCDPNRRQWDTEFPMDERNILYTVMGVDWAVANSTNSAFTVISVFGYDSQGKMHLLYCNRLDGVDVLDQVKLVIEVFRKFRCAMCCADRGVGIPQGRLLQNHLGYDKFHMVNYVAAKNFIRWDRTDMFYAADRTQALDALIFKAKAGVSRFVTPCWELCETFWQDALNLYEEESLSGRRLYRKPDGTVDDSAHSWTFANIAGMIVRGEIVHIDERENEEDDSVFAI